MKKNNISHTEELNQLRNQLALQMKVEKDLSDQLIQYKKEITFLMDENDKYLLLLQIAKQEIDFQTGEKEKSKEALTIADAEVAFQKNQNKDIIILHDDLEMRIDTTNMALKYSRSLIDASRDPFFIINTSGKITDLNEATIRITGIARLNLIGDDFYKYFTEPVKAKEAYQKIFSESFIADFPLTIIDGVLTEVLLNGSVYKNDNGEVLGAVIVAHDITGQKQIEKDLIEARTIAELATDIAELAKNKAEESVRIAEVAVKAKQQFLSNMSHEIRTPMNAIIGFTKVVLKTNLTDKQKEYLTAIKISGDALIVLINDILDLAKVDAGKMTFQQVPFHLASSVSVMLHLFETKIQEKNLKLIKDYDFKLPDVIVGDPARLHQIILNLVSNAVKFTTTGKLTVSVKLVSENETDINIEFSVSDTGIGIEEDKLEKIFDDFQQATSETSKLYGGTGLGLAIVKQLVESQGGKVSVKSKLNSGSTFSFILPFQKTNKYAEVNTVLKESDYDKKSLKVLVVEDILLNQLLMKAILDEFGFERDIAANGRIAIEMLSKNSYDVILMDLQMPEMNGFEATEYIRNTLKLNIPIIALTADVTTVDLDKCKSVGMDDYIAKPVDERVLYDKIISVVKKASIIKVNESLTVLDEKKERGKCIDMNYLTNRTKSNPILMQEMIELYLQQTPNLVNTMKQSLLSKDWDSLNAAAHKIIPSFSIVGIKSDFEIIAKKIQEYAVNQQNLDAITEMVMQIEMVCLQACKELNEELIRIKGVE